MAFSSLNWTLQIEKGFERMSEAVFAGMCQMVGTSRQLAIRRDAWNITEIVDRKSATDNDSVIILSGSRREGFVLKDSDWDYMIWFANHRVILDISQSERYNTANITMILSDNSESLPGFYLLQLLLETRIYKIQSACVRMNNKLFISSLKFRDLFCSESFPNSTIHGPCGSGFLGPGMQEYDTAVCFVCDFWPQSASAWIERCHSWPSNEVVNDIVRNGCHFVAVGHPLGLHPNEEWRISFSQAEHKCVHAMNHCQFLTYGLLKIFLKEVIKQQFEEIGELLCSYHMKTVVFWAIQQNALSYWCPQNILVGFWVCFKLLLKWVYEGICPNFFIPENNLFLSKVHGSAQNRLFLQLHELYKTGLTCLLQSSSIRSHIIEVFYNPRILICTNEDAMMSEVDHDMELFSQPYSLAVPRGNLCDLVRVLQTISHLLYSPLTHYQILSLQARTVSILHSIAFVLIKMVTNISTNKIVYQIDKIACYLMKLVTRFGCVSDMLYIAKYYYKTCRYRKALTLVDMTQVNFAQPYVIHSCQVNREIYTEAFWGQSFSSKIKQAKVIDQKLNTNIDYISELSLELLSSRKNRNGGIFIPSFVMLYFLEFLCYRQIDTTLSKWALGKLMFLVHVDPGLLINELCRDISWEILGICQEIEGYPQDALYSYQQSLKQFPWHKIQSATQWRIQSLTGQIPAQ